MEAIENYINCNYNINHEELYNKLIEKYYNNNNNSIFIINFIMYDKFKYYPLNSPNPEIIKLAKERIGQTEFRYNIINRDKVCIITGDDADICEACHIIPFNECKNYNINNGILLNKNLHDMFDKYYFSFNNNKIILSNKILNKKAFINYHKYHNNIINIPKECIENLNIHFNKFIKNEYNN